MADVERPKPLAFGQRISKTEAEERFEEVNGLVDEIKVKYALPANGSGQSRGRAERMQPEDQEMLQKCMAVLMAMSSVYDVQVEAARDDIPLAEMLLVRLISMQEDVMIFAASFEGSGITVHIDTLPETPSAEPHVQRGLLGGVRKLFRRK